MPNLYLTLLPQAAQVQPGEQLSFALSIENGGSLPRHCAIRVIGLQRDSYDLDRADVLISPAGAEQIQLSVQPAAGAAPGRYPFKVEVSVDGEPALRARAIATLTVGDGAVSAQDLTPAGEMSATGAARADAQPERSHSTPRHADTGATGPLRAAAQPAPSAPRAPRFSLPSWWRLRHAGFAFPILAVLVMLLGLVGLATARGLVALSPRPAHARQPTAPARPTATASVPATRGQRPQGQVKGIVVHATEVAVPPRIDAFALRRQGATLYVVWHVFHAAQVQLGQNAVAGVGEQRVPAGVTVLRLTARNGAGAQERRLYVPQAPRISAAPTPEPVATATPFVITIGP